MVKKYFIRGLACGKCKKAIGPIRILSKKHYCRNCGEIPTKVVPNKIKIRRGQSSKWYAKPILQRS